jgi:putative tryptophan/tyrosine transport system substrate-binding protein
VSDADELARALATMNEERPGGVIALQDPTTLQANRRRIVDFVARHCLTAMDERREWVDAGGLMSYGVSFPANFRRTAS